jgi:membrane-bound metal-dependent hydrolase YbcI (DUF457 family)
VLVASYSSSLRRSLRDQQSQNWVGSANTHCACGSMIPDIEVSVVMVPVGLTPSRGLMHSLVGAVTVDAFLAILVTVFLYPLLVSWIFKLEKKDAVEKCLFSGMFVLSALIGTLSHVVIDAIHHEYNPLLYPFNSQSFEAFMFLND